MAELIKKAETPQPAAPIPGVGLDTISGMAFNTHDNVIIAVRVAIIDAYRAQGLSLADAEAKFEELNPSF